MADNRANGTERADWRFLLPRTSTGKIERMAVLGAGDSLLGHLREERVAGLIETSLASSVDCIALLRNSPLAPEDTVANLAAGGIFYWEIDRRKRGNHFLSPRRARRRIEHLNLRVVQSYWVAPDFSTARRFIPLGIPAAMDWYLDTLYVAGTAKLRALEIALRLASRGKGHPFAELVPCHALVAVATASSARYAPALVEEARERQLLTEVFDGAALITSGRDVASRAVMLPFVRARSRPAIAIKAAATHKANHHTLGEQMTLNHLASRMSGALRNTVPQNIGAFISAGSQVVVERSVPGRPLTASSGKWGVPVEQIVSDLRAVADWITRFNKQVQNGFTSDWSSRWIEPLILEYRTLFNLSEAEDELLDMLHDRAAVLCNTALPVVWQHSDLGPWNIYRDEQSVTIMDWEYSGEAIDARWGPPLYDLIYFVIHWFYLARHCYTVEAEDEAFYELFVAPTPRDPLVTAARREITRYMEAFDLDHQLWPLLLTSGWIERAIDQARRGRTMTEHQARIDNRASQYVRLLARHRLALFSFQPEW